MMPIDKNHPDQSNETTTGSPVSGGPAYLLVGILRRTHGVKGEMLMDLTTDFPERIRPHKVLFIGESHKPMTVKSVRKANRQIIIAFEGYHDCDQAAELRNQNVFVKTSELPKLPKGEYYHHELIGLTAITEDGQKLGKLEEIIQTGANEVYVIRSSDGSEILLPAIKEVILEIHPELGEMLVRPPEWE